jgi:hypothetical protein
MRAGERVFIDTPANWLAWADSLAPEDLNVDERVRRLLPSGERRAEPPPSGPTSGSNAEVAVQTAEDIEPDVDSQSDEPNTQSSAPGRPSRRAEIETAYKALHDDGKIDYRSKCINYSAIRQKIGGRSDVVEDGLGDDAIRKAIKLLFDAEKAEADKAKADKAKADKIDGSKATP